MTCVHLHVSRCAWLPTRPEVVLLRALLVAKCGPPGPSHVLFGLDLVFRRGSSVYSQSKAMRWQGPGPLNGRCRAREYQDIFNHPVFQKPGTQASNPVLEPQPPSLLRVALYRQEPEPSTLKTDACSQAPLFTTTSWRAHGGIPSECILCGAPSTPRQQR